MIFKLLDEVIRKSYREKIADEEIDIEEYKEWLYYRFSLNKITVTEDNYDNLLDKMLEEETQAYIEYENEVENDSK